MGKTRFAETLTAMTSNSATELRGTKRRRGTAPAVATGPAGSVVFYAMEELFGNGVCLVQDSLAATDRIIRRFDTACAGGGSGALGPGDMQQIVDLHHNLTYWKLYDGAVPEMVELKNLRRLGAGSIVWLHALLCELGLRIALYTCCLGDDHGTAPCPSCMLIDVVGREDVPYAVIWVPDTAGTHVCFLGNAPTA